jgi:serine/threonine-protein kinase
MTMRALAIVLVSLFAITASAAPSARDLAQARAHFRAGESAFKIADYERAIKEYQAAYDLAPRPLLLFNIGSAYRRRAESTGAIEDKKQAVAAYQRYLEADANGKAVGDAQGFIAALTREIDAAQAAPVAEPPPAQAPVAAAPPVAPPPIAVPTPSPGADQGSSRSGLRIAGLATAGVGVALLATGVYFALQAKSKADEVDGLTDQWNRQLDESGKAAQRNAYLCAGIGAAAVAGGAVMYFVLGKRAEAQPVTVGAAPSRAGGGAFFVAGRF